MPEPGNEMGAELLMLRNYVSELAARHNSMVTDVESEFRICGQRVVNLGESLNEVNRKLGITETTFLVHDQRIQSCDTWIKAMGKDMADHVQDLIQKAKGITRDFKTDLKLVEEYVQEVTLDRLDALERNLTGLHEGFHPEVNKQVVECLNAEQGPKLASMTLEASEAAGSQLLSRIVALELHQEGVQSDLLALGSGVE